MNETLKTSVPVLELRQVTKYYNKNYAAVNNLSLTIPRGKIIGLLGPNGSGKSTLIKMINGLLTPTSGEILINGLHPGVESKKIVSYLPERTYLHETMNVEQIVSYFSDFYEDFSTARAYDMLGRLNINTKEKLKTLSKGTKEKIQLILVMSREAELYILDEPIAGVDPAARDYILNTIITNYNENATIILSTHLISDIENILDEAIFIHNGNFVLYQTVETIREEQNKSIDAYFREVFSC